jgi:hypothetical protein
MKVRRSTCSPRWPGGACEVSSMPITVGLVFFCSKNEIVPTDGAKLLEQFPTPAARGPENRENVRHKSLPGVAGGG